VWVVKVGIDPDLTNGPYLRRMRCVNIRRVVALAAAAVTGCSGGPGAVGSLLPLSSTTAPSSVHAAHAARGGRKARVTLRIAWARKRGRTAHYIPATARSISISVNGGTAQYVNAPATKIAVDAPVGPDTFAIGVYDAAGGQGNLLSHVLVTKRVALGVANTLSATLDGVVASLSVALSNPSPAAGVAAQSLVQVTAFDADGNVIVGAADYSNPIQLSLGDPEKSGTLSLSGKLLQTPSSVATLTYSGGTLWSGEVVASASGAAPASATFAPKPTVYEYRTISAAAKPIDVVQGGDGRMWFTEYTGKIGAATLNGTISEYGSASAAVPACIVAGSDGALWYTEYAGSKIARVTTSGLISHEYATTFAFQGPVHILDRGDGTLWYAAADDGRLGQLSLDGSAQSETAKFGGGSSPAGMVQAGGYVWFADTGTGSIGRMSSIGDTPSTFALASTSEPQNLVLASDGHLWITESGVSRIGVMDLSGTLLAEYPTLHPNASPIDITKGRDGALWFSEGNAGRIGRITLTGDVSEYAVPSANSVPDGITTASDGSIWFTEYAGSKIGKLVY
jgi:virginiamycin B lyase